MDSVGKGRPVSPMTDCLRAGGMRDDCEGRGRRVLSLELLPNGKIDACLEEWGGYAHVDGLGVTDRRYFGGCGDTVEEAMADLLNAAMAKMGEENAKETNRS